MERALIRSRVERCRLGCPVVLLFACMIGPWTARAFALQGDTAKAKGAYQEFLALWKDADVDIPAYRQAKAEYAKLQ